jgi:hypothetical protein
MTNNNTFLGATLPSQDQGVPVVSTGGSGSGSFSVISDSPNPDGTYNISIPDEYKSDTLVAKETDSQNEDVNQGPDTQNQIAKYLPLFLGLGIAFFIITRNKKK